MPEAAIKDIRAKAQALFEQARAQHAAASAALAVTSDDGRHNVCRIAAVASVFHRVATFDPGPVAAFDPVIDVGAYAAACLAGELNWTIQRLAKGGPETMLAMAANPQLAAEIRNRWNVTMNEMVPYVEGALQAHRELVAAFAPHPTNETETPTP